MMSVMSSANLVLVSAMPLLVRMESWCTMAEAAARVVAKIGSVNSIVKAG